MTNIPYECSEDELKTLFAAQIGPVRRFNLIYDKITGRPKGYGFCEFTNFEDAQLAIQVMKDWVLKGRPLRVEEDRSFPTNNDTSHTNLRRDLSY